MSLFIACTSDTFAYLGGNMYGKTFISSISPKKTWEGFLIGCLCSLLCLCFFKKYLHFINIKLFFSISYINTFMLFLFIFIISFLGDLVISIFKRYREIKDTSNILPGHGGVLDRIDSIIPANVFLLSYIGSFYSMLYYSYI